MPYASSGDLPPVPSLDAIRAAVDACERYCVRLVDAGCDTMLALDRVWDVYEKVVMHSDREILFEADRQLEAELLTIVEGNDNA